MSILKDKMNASEFRDYLAKKEKAKTSLYKAIPAQTADGEKFQSELEATYYNRLWVLHRAKEVTLIERQVRYELTVNGHFIAAYLLDFRVTYADGRIEFIDVKSQPTKTAVYMIKKKLMLALHGIEIKEVFE